MQRSVITTLYKRLHEPCLSKVLEHYTKEKTLMFRKLFTLAFVFGALVTGIAFWQQAPVHAAGTPQQNTQATLGALPCSSKPAAPQLPPPTDFGISGEQPMHFDWNDVACATKYKVVVKRDSPAGPQALKKAVRVSNLTTQVLSAGYTYYWRVKACNTLGCTKSEWRSFTINPKVVLSPFGTCPSFTKRCFMP
jgi:hypothetical protein